MNVRAELHRLAPAARRLLLGEPAPIGRPYRLPDYAAAASSSGPAPAPPETLTAVLASTGPLPNVYRPASEIALRGGSRVAVLVGGGGAFVQFDPAQPPTPPSWSGPEVPLAIGWWSHAQAFGYVRFRAAANLGATVSATAYADPLGPAPGQPDT